MRRWPGGAQGENTRAAVRWWLILPVLSISFVAASCSSDDDEQDASAEAAKTTVEDVDDVTTTEDTVFVRGTSGGSECSWSERDLREDDDPTIDVYTGTLVCPSEMSDPRVSGIEEWELTEPFYYTNYLGEPETGRFEASATLTTDDGVWRGDGFGSDMRGPGGSGLRTTFYVEYVGEGAYEGLTYREWGAQYPGSDHYLIVGYIEPAE